MRGTWIKIIGLLGVIAFIIYGIFLLAQMEQITTQYRFVAEKGTIEVLTFFIIFAVTAYMIAFFMAIYRIGVLTESVNLLEDDRQKSLGRINLLKLEIDELKKENRYIKSYCAREIRELKESVDEGDVCVEEVNNTEVVNGSIEKQPDEKTVDNSGEIKCPNCGNLVDLEDVFCDQCGTRLKDDREG